MRASMKEEIGAVGAPCGRDSSRYSRAIPYADTPPGVPGAGAPSERGAERAFAVGGADANGEGAVSEPAMASTGAAAAGGDRIAADGGESARAAGDFPSTPAGGTRGAAAAAGAGAGHAAGAEPVAALRAEGRAGGGVVPDGGRQILDCRGSGDVGAAAHRRRGGVPAAGAQGAAERRNLDGRPGRAS